MDDTAVDPTLEFWTAKEVARYLRCHVATVKRYAKLGLPHIRRGGKHMLFRPADVVAWVNQDYKPVSDVA